MSRFLLDRFLLVGAALLLTSCGGGGDGGGVTGPALGAADVCPADIEKDVVLSIMEEWYFFNDEPDQSSKYLGIDLDDFDDGEDLLDFLRFMPDELDRNFSFITTVEEDETFFGAGQAAAFGIGIQTVTEVIWITDVINGSPADQGGLARGDRIVAIDGRSIAEIVADEGVSVALGPREAGVTRTLNVEFGTGGNGDVTLTKAVIDIEPVPSDKVQSFDVNGQAVGYLLLRSFVSTADAPLRAAFQDLGASGIQHLVVDLRYNGGGLLSLAQTLSSLLAGPGSAGSIFSEQRFNSNKAQEGLNEITPFISLAESLSLDRVVFIVTDGSASASEMVINGLEPYSDIFGGGAQALGPEILLVGESTGGKPVGQIAIDYCPDPDTGEFTKRLRPVAFETVNVLGEGQYFDGLAVDCAAEDDLSQPLGDPNEDSLATALQLSATGSCPGLVVSNKPSPPPRRSQESGGTGARYARVW